MGRLVDADELLKAMNTWDKFGNIPKEGLIPLRTPTSRDRYVPYVKYDDMIKCVKGMPTVEAIPKDQYEARLKANLKAMLTDMKEELKHCEIIGLWKANYREGFNDGMSKSLDIIQQKINELKEIKDEKK